MKKIAEDPSIKLNLQTACKAEFQRKQQTVARLLEGAPSSFAALESELTEQAIKNRKELQTKRRRSVLRDKTRAHQIKNLVLIQLKRKKKKIRKDLLQKLQEKYSKALINMKDLSRSHKEMANSKYDSVDSAQNFPDPIQIVNDELADMQRGGGVLRPDFESKELSFDNTNAE